MSIPEKAFLRPDEVARLFQVSRSTIYQWIDSGKISAVRIAGFTVRIPREAVQAVLRDTSE